MVRSFALGLAAWAVAASAAAGPPVGALAGAWVFETEPHGVSGCVIRGEAAARAFGPALAIEIRAHETCPGGAEWRAVQSCRGEQRGEALEVRCVLVSAEPDNYVADQFDLVVESGDRMRGRLADGALWDVAVTWRRPRAPLVS